MALRKTAFNSSALAMESLQFCTKPSIWRGDYVFLTCILCFIIIGYQIWTLPRSMWLAYFPNGSSKFWEHSVHGIMYWVSTETDILLYFIYSLHLFYRWFMMDLWYCYIYLYKHWLWLWPCWFYINHYIYSYLCWLVPCCVWLDKYFLLV